MPSRLALTAVLLVTACGARTGLPTGERRGSEPEDAGVDVVDATLVEDAPFDSGEDAPDVEDARPEVVVIDCQEAGITYVYLISSESKLLSFYPPTKKFDTIGTISCPASAGATPYSMAVDRLGVAYVLFNDGQVFRVSTLTASCQPTGFVPQQSGFANLFGMGFSSNELDGGETLYVIGTESGGGPRMLATINPSSFVLRPVGPLSSAIGDAELTGTGDGRLFGFAPGFPQAHLAEIGKSDGAIRSDVLLDLGAVSTTAWAFAFWGGSFYFFTAESTGRSEVHRYAPGDSTSPPVFATANVTIVGAGVSTCAPAE